MPAVQVNAWQAFDGGKAKVSPDTLGIAEAVSRDGHAAVRRRCSDATRVSARADLVTRRRVGGARRRDRRSARGAWTGSRAQGVPWFTAPGLRAGHARRADRASRRCCIVCARCARRAPSALATHAAGEATPRAIAARVALRATLALVPRLRRGPRRPRRAVLASPPRCICSCTSSCCSYPSGARAARSRAARSSRVGDRDRRVVAISLRVPGRSSSSAFPDASDVRRPLSRSAARSRRSRASGRSSTRSARRCSASSSAACPGSSATLAHRAADDADDQDAAERRDPDPDLHVRRHDLRRQPHGDPAQHPRHARRTRPRASTAISSRGRARPAARWASRPPARSLGSLFGIVCLALFTPSLGEIALTFGAFEFFWLALFGVLMSGSITGTDPLKGWLMGFAGLFATLIGQDGIHAHNRFTFGNRDLAGGIVADSRADRRVRLLRDPDRAVRAGAQGRSSKASTR